MADSGPRGRTDQSRARGIAAGSPPHRGRIAHCDAPGTDTCVACLGDGNCQTGEKCNTTTHACVANCTGNGMCQGQAPYCGPANYCVQCLGNGNCTAPRGVCTNNACTCDAGLTTCGGFGGGGCVDLKTSANNCGACGTQCGFGESCTAGKCGCPGGGTVCNGQCVDLTSSPAHCGACGTMCQGGGQNGETCQAGKCQAGACTGGLTSCNRACVDLKTNFFHCGDCGNRCNADETCVAGACQ